MKISVLFGGRRGCREEVCVEWVLRQSGIFEIFLTCSGRVKIHQLFLGKKGERGITGRVREIWSHVETLGLGSDLIPIATLCQATSPPGPSFLTCLLRG